MPALAVMVTVNDSAAKLRADLVELVAEMSHLVGAVFITRDDFVDGVNNNGHVIRFLRPGNDFWCQLVHRDRLATKVPDFYVVVCIVPDAQGLPNHVKAVKAGWLINFKIDVKNLATLARKMA